MKNQVVIGLLLLCSFAGDAYAEEGGAIDVSAPFGLAIFALLFLVFRPKSNNKK